MRWKDKRYDERKKWGNTWLGMWLKNIEIKWNKMRTDKDEMEW